MKNHGSSQLVAKQSKMKEDKQPSRTNKNLENKYAFVLNHPLAILTGCPHEEFFGLNWSHFT